jgi:hypothetical protein
MKGRTGSLLRRFSLGFLAAGAMLMAVPSGASSATQIGETFVPDVGCSADTTFAQGISPGGKYAAPSDGVITKWSFQAPTTGPDKLAFKVSRPAPGADLTMDADFTVIGESGLVDPVADKLNTYPVQITVKKGDVIGFYWDAGNVALPSCGRVMTGYTLFFEQGDVPPGTTRTFTNQADRQIDISALLEPDCDKDGLGDETQDKIFTNAACPGEVTCKGRFLTIVGTDGPDEIVGTPNRDVIAALDGNDKVLALGGDDIVCGNRGKDRLLGQDGEDVLKGNRGKDTEKGGADDDTLKGNRGADLLKGKGGEDFLGGGKGDDTCRGGGGDDKQKSC